MAETTVTMPVRRDELVALLVHNIRLHSHAIDQRDPIKQALYLKRANELTHYIESLLPPPE